MKDFINYNQQLALRELGFNEPCFGIYNINMDILPIIDEPYVTTSKYGAILLSQAFRFFREKYDFYVIIHSSLNHDFFPVIRASKAQYHIGNFNSYEEAESACLDKLIELAKMLNLND